MIRTIKRFVTVGAIAGALMYAGDQIDFKQSVLDPIFNNKPIEEGYQNPRNISVASRVNNDGKIEGYLVFSNGERYHELPILINGSGLQVGENSYWWSSISQDERNNFVTTGWDDLGIGEKTRIVEAEFNNLAEYSRTKLITQGWREFTPEKKGKLVTESWGELEKNTKYAIIKTELEQVLDSFYEQTQEKLPEQNLGGGNNGSYSSGF